MALNNISLMGPNPAQPFDIQTQQAMLEQQRAIANALIAQSLAEKSPVIRTAVGNPFGRDVANWQDPVSNIAKAFIGGNMQKEAMGGQAELADVIQRRREAALPAMLNAASGEAPRTISGMRAPDESGAVGGGEPFNTQGVAPNPKAAIDIAAISRDPVLMKMAEKIFEGIPQAKDYLAQARNIDLSSVPGAIQTGNVGAVLAKPEAHVSDGGLFFTQGKNQVAPATAVQKYKTEIESTTGTPVNVSELTGKAQGISGGNLTPSKKIEEMLGAEATKTLGEGRKVYQEGITAMGNVAQLKSDIAAAPDEKFGSFASTRNALNRFTELLGGKASPETADIEAVKSNLGKLLLKDVRALAPVTENDVKMIQQIVGTEGLTKRGLLRVLDTLEQGTARTMAQHEQFVKDFALPPQMSRDQFQKMWVPEFSFKTLPPPGTSKNPYADKSDDELRQLLNNGR